MKTTYPIVLAHGICPIDRLLEPFVRPVFPNDARFQYFRDIPGVLENHGFTAFYARVSWAASREKRALDLMDQIRRFTQGFQRWPKVHIIAHSMGGLDARTMIFRHRLESRVASLTTIGSPHLGTSLADWGVRRLGWIPSAACRLGLDLSGLRDLTRDACRLANERMADFERQAGVLYRTVAGARRYEKIRPALKPAFRIIEREEGENDGLVPLRSACWEERYLLRVIDADHLNMIGWWSRRDAFYGLNRTAFKETFHRLYLDIADHLGN